MRELAEIVVHCSDTRPEWMAGQTLPMQAAEIRQWHIARGWRREGYHFFIGRDGSSMAGRPVEEVGAHVIGHNARTIGICLIGGHGSAKSDLPGANFTPRQLDELRRLVLDLMAKHPGIKRVTGHNQYAAKACPGFYVPTWWAEASKPRLSLLGFIRALFGR